MSGKIKIAVDAMGGENSPKKVIDGIIEKIHNWENYDKDDKLKIFNLYIENKDNNQKIVDYFEKYYIYLTKISLNSFIKSVIEHKF